MNASRMSSRVVRRLFWCTVMFFIGASLWACHTVPKPLQIERRLKGATIETNTWEEGLQAFLGGDYQRALAVFEFLSENTGDETIYRRALYGLATTHLLLAQDAAEFNEAMGLWDCWSQQAPWGIEAEDPRIMTPLLERIGSFLSPEKRVKKEGKSDEKTVYKNRLVSRDLVVYKNLLVGKEKEVERLKSRIEAREREVRRLKHQIESLEAIHLKYQEKQKEISSP